MPPTYTAFVGTARLAAGDLEAVALAAHEAQDRQAEMPIVFDDASGSVVDLDLRGGQQDVLDRLRVPEPPQSETPRPRGRPRLGVTAREVTLLPRHWDWLASQPGGASVALRKLVESALREAEGPDRVRRSREAAYRFMTAVAGDQPDYEEATRMLFAGDWVAFDAAIEVWPSDVRDYARRLAEGSWRNGQGRDA